MLLRRQAEAAGGARARSSSSPSRIERGRRPALRRVGDTRRGWRSRRPSEGQHRLRAPARDGHRQHRRSGSASSIRSSTATASSSTCATTAAATSTAGFSRSCCARRGSTGSRASAIPTWNMQYAFRGHMVVLCDEYTASDGEAFAEGFRRLGLGKVIGTRTWGGEIWLSASNMLVDSGIATAAETGVYGPEGRVAHRRPRRRSRHRRGQPPARRRSRGRTHNSSAAIEYLQERDQESSPSRCRPRRSIRTRRSGRRSTDRHESQRGREASTKGRRVSHEDRSISLRPLLTLRPLRLCE